MKAGKIIAGLAVFIAATLFFSIFIVKEVNQAIVLQFGDPKRIILKPGLNFKLPYSFSGRICFNSKSNQS